MMRGCMTGGCPSSPHDRHITAGSHLKPHTWIGCSQSPVFGFSVDMDLRCWCTIHDGPSTGQCVSLCAHEFQVHSRPCVRHNNIHAQPMLMSIRVLVPERIHSLNAQHLQRHRLNGLDSGVAVTISLDRDLSCSSVCTCVTSAPPKAVQGPCKVAGVTVCNNSMQCLCDLFHKGNIHCTTALQAGTFPALAAHPQQGGQQGTDHCLALNMGCHLVQNCPAVHMPTACPRDWAPESSHAPQLFRMPQASAGDPQGQDEPTPCDGHVRSQPETLGCGRTPPGRQNQRLGALPRLLPQHQALPPQGHRPSAGGCVWEHPGRTPLFLSVLTSLFVSQTFGIKNQHTNQSINSQKGLSSQRL